MRAISIRQPWASLTAAGIRDIDISNRDTKYRGRILIHASSRRVGRDFGTDIPQDWLCRLRNAQMMGLVPYDEEVPLSAVIGIAELTDCVAEMQDSPWSAAGNNWVLRDMQIFDEPVFGVKGKQGLFDVAGITEGDLPPHHQPMQPWSSYDTGTFSLSMSEAEIERQIVDWPLVIMICDDRLATPLLSGDKLREVHHVRLSAGQSEKTFAVREAEIRTEEMAGHQVRYIALHLCQEHNH